MRNFVLLLSLFILSCSTTPSYRFTSDYNIKVMCDDDSHCITQREFQIIIEDLIHFLEKTYPHRFWRERIKIALSERFGEHKLIAIKPTTRGGFECTVYASGKCAGLFQRWDGKDGRVETKITVATVDEKCVANNSFTHELVHLIIWAVERERGHGNKLLWEVVQPMAKERSIKKLCKEK